MNNIYKYIKEYLIYIQFEKKLSNNTINSYWLDLKSFADYMQDIHINNLNKINIKDLSLYISDLQKYSHVKEYKISSLNRKISSIKSFYKFLIMNEYVKKDIYKTIIAIKPEKKIPVVLSVEEINTFIKSIDLNKKNGFRDISIVELLYSSGLRVSELINLKLNNIYLNDDVIKIFGKGNKERIVPIGAAAKKYLLKYKSSNFMYSSFLQNEYSNFHSICHMFIGMLSLQFPSLWYILILPYHITLA